MPWGAVLKPTSALVHALGPHSVACARALTHTHTHTRTHTRLHQHTKRTHTYTCAPRLPKPLETQDYKDFLESLLKGDGSKAKDDDKKGAKGAGASAPSGEPVLADYKEHHSDTTVGPWGRGSVCG